MTFLYVFMSLNEAYKYENNFEFLVLDIRKRK